jgi:hypothetical protein
MDPLTQTLVNRALPDQINAASRPAVLGHAKTPPAQQRADTAQDMQDAYRNNWNPNPILLRVLAGRSAK